MEINIINKVLAPLFEQGLIEIEHDPVGELLLFQIFGKCVIFDFCEEKKVLQLVIRSRSFGVQPKINPTIAYVAANEINSKLSECALPGKWIMDVSSAMPPKLHFYYIATIPYMAIDAMHKMIFQSLEAIQTTSVEIDNLAQKMSAGSASLDDVFDPLEDGVHISFDPLLMLLLNEREGDDDE